MHKKERKMSRKNAKQWLGGAVHDNMDTLSHQNDLRATCTRKGLHTQRQSVTGTLCLYHHVLRSKYLRSIYCGGSVVPIPDFLQHRLPSNILPSPPFPALPAPLTWFLSINCWLRQWTRCWSSRSSLQTTCWTGLWVFKCGFSFSVFLFFIYSGYFKYTAATRKVYVSCARYFTRSSSCHPVESGGRKQLFRLNQRLTKGRGWLNPLSR